MPASTPNPSGSADPKLIPYGQWESFPSEKYNKPWGDKKCIIYNSPNRDVLAGTIYAHGKGTYTWPCDEFIYVSRGWITWEVLGGESFKLVEGDVIYIKEGTTASYEMSPDYANIIVFYSGEGKELNVEDD
ncbi:hypothetical protein LTR84_005792 [Exophiala bonariae]|uniref:(S)-ureidoglycine aminohydrolase cupin domain-containing protein n=1 Tax=Exophiala bonariae TaxID=1690606 RepID=A0AAV9N5M1_9EURO|nr:hypothetical protein LTR84_005792 [Exophiala bonariae]